MSMEKITKEELLEKLGGTPLSDDELEKVAGGFVSLCIQDARVDEENCFFLCQSGNQPFNCTETCIANYDSAVSACKQN